MSSSVPPSIEPPFTTQSSLSTPPLSNPPTATSVRGLGVLSSPQRLDRPSDGLKACTGQKRTRFEFSNPPKDDPLLRDHPSKKEKVLLTTVSAMRRQEVADIHSRRALDLARASRNAFAAQAMYRLLRIRELDIMRTIAHDEYGEAQSFVRDADSQIGCVRHTLATQGILYGGPSDNVPAVRLSPIPSCSSDSCDTDELDVKRFKRPGKVFIPSAEDLALCEAPSTTVGPSEATIPVSSSSTSVAPFAAFGTLPD